MRRKSTGSKLDGIGEDHRRALVELADGVDGKPPMTLEALCDWLRAEWDITIGKSALSDWLAKQRDAKEYDAFLEKVRDAAIRAEEITGAMRSGADIADAVVAGLGTALQTAMVAGNQAERDMAAKSFAVVLGAHAANKKADAAIELATTARDKFRFEAAKAALRHAAELQEINRSDEDDKTKVARAIKRIFGDKPKGVRTAAEVLEEEAA